MSEAKWTRYVALGDSITEGLCDPLIGRGAPWLGWADRLAIILDGHAHLGGGSVEFANLGVHGRRVADVVDDQIPRALELEADLVSVMIGGNDLMGAKADPDELAAKLETGIVRLRASGTDVLLANAFDPQFALFLRPLRGRAAVFNANLWTIAREHETFTLDLWGIRELQNQSMWAEDRVHLTTTGHRLLATRAAQALGVAYAEVPALTLATTAPPSLGTTGWLRRHALPWFARRVTRTSLGDGVDAKLPTPIGATPRPQ